MRRAIAVSIMPGSTMATRTLNIFISPARASLSASRAHFDAMYDDSGAETVSERPSQLPVNDEPYHAAKEKVVAHFEREYFARLVHRAGGNMSKAARLAGVDRTTLYRLMDKHQLPRDERAGETE